jgi:hypothetical protein
MNYVWSFLAGLLIGAGALAWWQAPQEVTETHAVAARQADGSLVLERTATNPKAKPTSAIPKGGKAERIVSVDIQPVRADYPICTVDLTLVRMPDDSRRVVASSPTGTVIGGLDVPIVPLVIAPNHPWAAGALYNGRWGALVTRDVRFLSVGGAVTQDHDGGFSPWAVLVIRF